MPDSAVIPATTTYRMTSLAWALAVHTAAETLRDEAGVNLPGYRPGPEVALLAGLDEPARAGIAGELTTAGITDAAGNIHPRWLRALEQAATAPIRVSLVSRWDGLSTHCRVDLFDGRGIAVAFTRPVATAADGRVAAAGVADVVTVTLLSEAVLWPVLARSMPPFPGLAAGVPPAPDPAAAAAAAVDVAAAKATVYLEVQSRAAGTGVPYRAAGVWALSESLYSVRTAGPATARRLVLAETADGDIARQLVWDVLGARDFLARRTSTEPAS